MIGGAAVIFGADELDLARRRTPSGIVGVNGIGITGCEIAGGRIRLTMTSPFARNRKPVVVFRGAVAARDAYLNQAGCYSLLATVDSTDAAYRAALACLEESE